MSVKRVVNFVKMFWIRSVLFLVRGKGWFDMCKVVEVFFVFVWNVIWVNFWIKVGKEWFDVVLYIRVIVFERLFLVLVLYDF